jgi:hypothetical protein
MSGGDFVFLALAVQAVLLGLLARSRAWRATGCTALATLAVVYVLWQLTDGGQRRSEAWLVLSSLPLIGLGAFFWKRGLGKLSAALGVALTLALLGVWAWASAAPAGSQTAAVVLYASLVLVAMVALFLLAGSIGLAVIVERDRARQRAEIARREGRSE